MEFLLLRRNVPSGKEQGEMTGFEGWVPLPLCKIASMEKLLRFFMSHK